MSDLYPTPTRLALLRAIQAGEVWQNTNGESVEGGLDDPVRRVTAAIAEQQHAGWIVLVELKYGAKQWQLTDDGRTLLDGQS